MGVYIRGMEMPKNCNDCPLNYDSIDCMVADIALREKGDGDFLYEHERASNCPLVPVPPHGRLIDADELAERFWDGQCYFTEAIKRKLQSAPTIIPEEEGTEFFTKGHLHLGYVEEGET